MKKLIFFLLGLIAAVFIICAATVLTLNCGLLYEADIDNFNLTETTSYTREEIEANYKAMIDYNNLGGPDTLEFPTLCMSESGRIHFEQVRDVFRLMEYAAIICGIITVIGSIIMTRKRLITFRLWTGILTIALPSVVGIYAAVDWYGFFVTFHNLVFHNNYWIFDEITDPVITILPDGYFLHCLIMIIVLALAGAAAFIIWYIMGKRKIRRSTF